MEFINKLADTVKSGVDKVKTTLSGTNAVAQTSLPDVATAKAPSALGTAPETPGYTATGGRRIKRSRSHKKTRRGGNENAYGFAPSQSRFGRAVRPKDSNEKSIPASPSKPLSSMPPLPRPIPLPPKKAGRRTRRGGYTYIPLSGPNDGRIGFGPMQIRKRGGRRTRRGGVWNDLYKEDRIEKDGRIAFVPTLTRKRGGRHHRKH
jgi:hypothetical protein